MPDIKKLFQDLIDAIRKLDTTKQIIAGAVVLTIVGAIGITLSISGSKGKTVLFSHLEVKDFAAVTAKLEEMDIAYNTTGTSAIMVDPDRRDAIMVALAQDNLIPSGVHGWEIFDEEKWSETQFEKEIKLQRALTGHLSRMLSTIKSVEKADVSLAFPSEEFFEDNIDPVTASVLLTFAPGIEELKRKEIEGIVTLVSRSVPGLKKEDVTVAGPDGQVLNDFDNAIDKERWELKAVQEKLKIQEGERKKLLAEISRSLQSNYGVDRAEVVRLNLELSWDKEVIDENRVSPVVMIPDNPATPYSELVTKDSLVVSEKNTEEKFIGRGFTPEGPAGAEPNIPPGYKDKDYQKAEYNKNEKITNNKFNESNHQIEKQPWQVEKITLAVWLDGRWEKKGIKEDGSGYIREYHPVSEEEIASVADGLKKAIGFDLSRGDQVSVKHLQKDRTSIFEQEDEELRKKQAMRKMLLATFISLLVLILLVVIFQLVKREMERRRRLREEELAAQQQMMREAALRAIEDEGVEVELSLEEKARREMIENAINLAKDRPEEVAQLIRTWLAED